MADNTTHVDRPGEPSAASPEHSRLIWDPFLGVYAGQAPGRMQRRELTAECPFCADLSSGRVAPGAQAWMRPNDFPALLPPAGECHLLIYSPDHNRSFADLTPPEALAVVGLWQQAYRQLAPHYQAVMTWETSGAEIGQTQFHPHGQTYALAAIPDQIERELAAIERAARQGIGCPFCAERETEATGPRAVLSTEHWTSFVPPYARYPYQLRLTPRRHVPSVADLSDAEAAALAVLLPRLIRAYARVYHAPMPYMLALHQFAAERFHFHIELLPVGRAPGKLKLAASSEMGWGFWMNDSFPEAKAAELRDALAAETP
ncbi:MAG: galactose-1-phosphate uridylyltransferase [Ktedonobacterales bacterium]